MLVAGPADVMFNMTLESKIRYGLKERNIPFAGSIGRMMYMLASTLLNMRMTAQSHQRTWLLEPSSPTYVIDIRY
jgi:hypothetical protein